MESNMHFDSLKFCSSFSTPLFNRRPDKSKQDGEKLAMLEAAQP